MVLSVGVSDFPERLESRVTMRNIICIGGSSGALEALQRLVPQLPADLPAAVFIVRHIAPDSSGLLTEILQPKCSLPISEAVDGEPIRRGRIYIAPPNLHLLLERKNVKLASGPKENWVRPAIDPLFRTAAQFHGPRSIGVVLSGKLDDGSAGLWALKRRGGFAVVQDLEDAASPEMPRHAMAAVKVDAVGDAEEIGAALSEWCREPSGHAARDLSETLVEAENTHLLDGGAKEALLEQFGDAIGVVCPACGGQLWQLKEGPLRYRCHVGHGMSAHSLLAQQREVVEQMSWQIIRAIEEEDRLIEKILREKVPAETEDLLQRRLNRNAEKLLTLRPLLFKDQGDAAFSSDRLRNRGDDGTPVGGDSTDTVPVSRT